MDLNLTNKLALVTGSTAGIGNAIATALTNDGAEVIVNGRSPASVDDAVARLKSATGRRVHGFAGDLGTAEVAAEVARQYPDVEILVNNLGDDRRGPARRRWRCEERVLTTKRT